MLEFLNAIYVLLTLIVALGAAFVVFPWLLMFWPGWSVFR